MSKTKQVVKKKLYLDICTLCRPFDDQNLMRIRIETDAFYLILQNIRNETYEMVVSPVHFKEIEAFEDIKEQLELIALLNKLGKKPSSDLRKARERAEQLSSLKFGVADAAHLAFAEKTADYFISCDDKLLKKCNRFKVSVLAMNPVEFCFKEDLK